MVAGQARVLSFIEKLGNSPDDRVSCVRLSSRRIAFLFAQPLIHPSAWKGCSQQFAPAVFRWHHGLVDTATLREEQMKMRQPTRAKRSRSGAQVAFKRVSIGAMALGALAVGATAIGALAIGALEDMPTRAC